MIPQSFTLASRSHQPNSSRFALGNGVTIGGNEIVVAAGPCAVEDRKQIEKSARAAARSGATLLRGGAFKPRSSPYSFQGLGEDGLKLLADAGKDAGLPVVTEVLSAHSVELVARYADVLQVGSRNMQNFDLLRELGQISKPVLLKRGMSATLEEWVLAAEYILLGGNSQVILCERGIRSFEPATRNTLDLSAIPILKKWTHLPVMVDPSHGTGDASLVLPMSLAAIAAGADGLLIEIHPNPAEALSDGAQALLPEEFDELTRNCAQVAQAVGRKIRNSSLEHLSETG